MGRPVGFDRDEAVRVVMQEIWQHGYEACSVKAMSERLGITRSSFYNAFGSREALFREVLLRYFEITPDLPFAKAQRGDPILPLLSRTFRNVCRTRAADKDGKGCLAINSATELCNENDDLGPVLAGAVLGSLARLNTLLDWAVDQGELPPQSNTRGLALALQNLLIGVNTMSKIVRKEEDLWLATRTTLEGLGLYTDTDPTTQMQA